MRAPVQKTRPRRTGKKTVSTSAEGGAVGDATGSTRRGRTAHVRNRLIVAVAVVAAAIAGAGAPTVLAASRQLNDSQNLVTLSQRTQQALTLAHSLADERDDVTSYVAAGRPKAKAPSEQRGARVDRQVDELRADEDAPAALLKDLDGIAALRRAALTGKSSALEAHQAYSEAIAELHALAEDLADRMPVRAAPARTRSPNWTPPSSSPPPPAACSSRPSPSRAPRRPSSTPSRAWRPPRTPPRPPAPSSATR